MQLPSADRSILYLLIIATFTFAQRILKNLCNILEQSYLDV